MSRTRSTRRDESGQALVIMVGAIVQVHWQHGFSMQQQGFEYNFAILVICAGVFLLGAGTLSVDRIFRFRRREI